MSRCCCDVFLRVHVCCREFHPVCKTNWSAGSLMLTVTLLRGRTGLGCSPFVWAQDSAESTGLPFQTSHSTANTILGWLHKSTALVEMVFIPTVRVKRQMEERTYRPVLWCLQSSDPRWSRSKPTTNSSCKRSRVSWSGLLVILTFFYTLRFVNTINCCFSSTLNIIQSFYVTHS